MFVPKVHRFGICKRTGKEQIQFLRNKQEELNVVIFFVSNVTRKKWYYATAFCSRSCFCSLKATELINFQCCNIDLMPSRNKHSECHISWRQDLFITLFLGKKKSLHHPVDRWNGERNLKITEKNVLGHHFISISQSLFLQKCKRDTAEGGCN